MASTEGYVSNALRGDQAYGLPTTNNIDGGGMYNSNTKHPTIEDYENIFGPAARDIKQDPERHRRRQRWHLPDALKGHNPWLADRIDGLITDTTNSPFTTYLLPYKHIDNVDGKIQWNVWSFDEGMASRVPYESSARVLTQTKRSFAGYTVRQGLAIVMEANFMMSEAGQKNFKDQLSQVVHSIQYSNNFDVTMALIQAPSYEKHFNEKYPADSSKPALQKIRDYVDMFGYMQKNPNALDICIEDSKAILRSWGAKEPDFLLCNSKLTMQLQMHPERTQYFTQGEDGVRRLKEGPNINTYRGLKVVNTHSFSTEAGIRPRDLLARRVRVGEYYRFAPTCGQSIWECKASLYNEERDTWDCIDFKAEMDNIDDDGQPISGIEKLDGDITNPLEDNEDLDENSPVYKLASGLYGVFETNMAYADNIIDFFTSVPMLADRFRELANDKLKPILQELFQDETSETKIDEIFRRDPAFAANFNYLEDLITKELTDYFKNIPDPKRSKRIIRALAMYYFAHLIGKFWTANARGMAAAAAAKAGWPAHFTALNREEQTRKLATVFLRCIPVQKQPHEILLLRPNIEHQMFGIIMGKSGLDDLGATLWGQTQLECYSDSVHGIWGMSYKYNERAIVFNEKNLVRVWDIAYASYCGGKGTKILRVGEQNEFIENTGDNSKAYNGPDVIFIPINLLLNKPKVNWPSPTKITGDSQGNNNNAAIALIPDQDFHLQDIEETDLKFLPQHEWISACLRAVRDQTCMNKPVQDNAQENVTSCTGGIYFEGSSKLYGNKDTMVKEIHGSGHHGPDFVGAASKRNGKGMKTAFAPSSVGVFAAT